VELIRDVLKSQHEQLTKDISVRKTMLFEICMIGRTTEQARPTIIFVCENKIQRQRANKIVRASGVLEKYKGFRLGESTRPLRLEMSPRLLFGDDEGIFEAADKETSETLVYYSPPIKDIHGIPIRVPISDSNKETRVRKLTAGGIISIHGKFFALTVGHAFSDISDNSELDDNDTALELSIDSDDEEDDEMWEFQDNEFIHTTSQGQILSSIRAWDLS
jgi:hypothetical protein